MAIIKFERKNNNNTNVNGIVTPISIWARESECLGCSHKFCKFYNKNAAPETVEADFILHLNGEDYEGNIIYTTPIQSCKALKEEVGIEIPELGVNYSLECEDTLFEENITRIIKANLPSTAEDGRRWYDHIFYEAEINPQLEKIEKIEKLDKLDKLDK